MYQVGDLVQLAAEFSNNAEPPVLTDPTTVSFLISNPQTGAVVTVTPAKVSTGVYQYDLSITDHGDWWWRAVGTGAVQVVQETFFTVATPEF